MATEKRMIEKLPTGSTSEDGIWWEKHPTRRDIIEKIDEIIEALHTLLKEPNAVDAAPVVHGRWVPVCANPIVNKFYCSVCRIPSMKGNYCPNCGAKMDGGGDNAAD